MNGVWDSGLQEKIKDVPTASIGVKRIDGRLVPYVVETGHIITQLVGTQLTEGMDCITRLQITVNLSGPQPVKTIYDIEADEK